MPLKVDGPRVVQRDAGQKRVSAQRQLLEVSLRYLHLIQR
jgi:hypothetical protein